MIFDGRNGGTVELLDNVLVIRRKGVASILTQGLKGEKRIPYASITSVQFKEAGFTTGYIQFGISGGIESRRGVWDATTDENTVLFTKEAAEQFQKLRDIVEDRVAAARQGHSAPASAPPLASIADELTRLADLRDRGVLTDEEFAAQKSRLLGSGMTSPGPGASITQPGPSRSDVSAFRPKRQGSVEPVTEPPKRAFGKVMGLGCLVVLGIFVLLAAIGSVGSNNSGVNAMSVDENLTTIDMNATTTGMNATAPETGDASKTAQIAEEEAGQGNLTPSQANAARSAGQYLRMTGFSRDGLIDQLSSSAGDGYSVADATAAVDSLSVDWNENAARSARQYLDLSGFSCEGLIEQLSSRAGDKYTREQASYGARQAGAC